MTIMSHYTVGIITLFYLIGVFAVLLATNWGKLKNFFGNRTIPLRYALPMVALVFIFFWSWFSMIGQGRMLAQVKNVFGGVYTNMSKVEITEKGYALSEDSIREKVKEAMETGGNDDWDDYTLPVKDNTYLDRQPKLIRSAIGLDFFDVSNYGKLFRVFQYLTQGLLVFGLFILIWKRKEYALKAEYMAGVIGSFLLLFCAVFLPYFTVMTVTTTRLYAYTLFFISPLLVIGAERILVRFEK